MNAKPRSAPRSTATAQITVMICDNGIAQIPILDERGTVAGIIFAKKLAKSDADSHPVVTMASGLGTRLPPVTETIPKLMIEVGGRPIPETIIKRLRMHGFRSIMLCINHLADIIIDHFGNGFGVETGHARERQCMGTAGALSLLPPSDLPLIIMNGDILTFANFNQLLTFYYEHVYEHVARATMGLNGFQYQLSYGVVEVKSWNITSFTEKPVYDFFINAGIHVIGPEALALRPREQCFDMPVLFDVVAQERRAFLSTNIGWTSGGRRIWPALPPSSRAILPVLENRDQHWPLSAVSARVKCKAGCQDDDRQLGGPMADWPPVMVPTCTKPKHDLWDGVQRESRRQAAIAHRFSPYGKQASWTGVRGQ